MRQSLFRKRSFLKEVGCSGVTQLFRKGKLFWKNSHEAVHGLPGILKQRGLSEFPNCQIIHSFCSQTNLPIFCRLALPAIVIRGDMLLYSFGQHRPNFAFSGFFSPQLSKPRSLHGLRQPHGSSPISSPRRSRSFSRSNPIPSCPMHIETH
jgi:hypothetical protein